MPHQLTWMVPKKVLFGRMWGSPTADEIAAVSPAINREVATGEPPVHMIFDISAVTHTPFNVRDLNSLFSRDGLENFGWVVIISGSVIARFLASATVQLLRMRVRVFADQAAAFSFLNDVDSSLPDLGAIHVDDETTPIDKT